MDQFWAAPPVARTLTLLTFIESAAVYGGLLGGWKVIFSPAFLLKLWPDVWRFFTPFLLTGPRLDFIFDLYMMYNYASQLETGSPRFTTPGAFFIYVLFVASVIMLTAGVYLGASIFTSALIMAFIWTYCQDNKHAKTKFFVVSIPAPFTPLAMLLITMVMHGWGAAVIQSMGIVAAHMYDFITRIYPTFGGGRNFISTPGFVRRFFIVHTPWGEHRNYGTAFRPETQGQTTQSAAWTSSFQNQWGSRGTGRRLGGD